MRLVLFLVVWGLTSSQPHGLSQDGSRPCQKGPVNQRSTRQGFFMVKNSTLYHGFEILFVNRWLSLVIWLKYVYSTSVPTGILGWADLWRRVVHSTSGRVVHSTWGRLVILREDEMHILRQDEWYILRWADLLFYVRTSCTFYVRTRGTFYVRPTCYSTWGRVVHSTSGRVVHST